MMMTQRSCSNSRNEGAKFQHIPNDLVTEIFLRLPSNSISRFRCLSKLWDSTFSSPDFTEAFRTISCSRPKLLFACLSENKTFFFSSPQPQDSSPLTASFLTSFPVTCPYEIHHQWYFGATKGTVQSICNPSTGKILTLPEVKNCARVRRSSLGFDPIDKHLKVLTTTLSYKNGSYSAEQHQVLTLGNGEELSWRKITCNIQGFHSDGFGRRRHDGICINGILYYLDEDYNDGKCCDIVCFDVRYEKFSYIKTDKELGKARGKIDSSLVNYKGKLAKLDPIICSNHGIVTGINLWVLQDSEKNEWWSYAYVLPPPWKSIVEGPRLHFVGITNNGEIVMSPEYIGKCLYLVYYNPKRNTLTRVGIKGMEAYEKSKARIFLDYVEDLKPYELH
ncbi:unnamed protein product [Microthlaspi erraticum]|uniref:F-box domain-containing protein n=1 Tax=Microthlaspi erraticum TaxID=1685480 RepID=A0A6D2L7M0_9BRAS|nr:unnamed protein product [Microthlaspi erraticum]